MTKNLYEKAFFGQMANFTMYWQTKQIVGYRFLNKVIPFYIRENEWNLPQTQTFINVQKQHNQLWRVDCETAVSD